MPVKVCPRCHTQLDTRDWVAHQKTHARNSSPPGYRMNRKKALARDQWTCQGCGRTDEQLPEGVILECHHVDEDPENNELENLQTLCSECHPRKGRPWYSYAERPVHSPQQIRQAAQRARTRSSRPPRPTGGVRLS